MKDFYIANKLLNNDYKHKIQKDYYTFFEKINGINKNRERSFELIEKDKNYLCSYLKDKNLFMAENLYHNLFLNSNCCFYGAFSLDNRIVAHTFSYLTKEKEDAVNVFLFPVFSGFQNDNELGLTIIKNFYLLLYKNIEYDLLINNIEDIHFTLMSEDNIMHETLTNMGYVNNGEYYSKQLDLSLIK